MLEKISKIIKSDCIYGFMCKIILHFQETEELEVQFSLLLSYSTQIGTDFT